MHAAIRGYRAAQHLGALLSISFTSVVDYLFLLRATAQALRPAGARAMLYLAAAVSDFYIPPAQMATHKIQSSIGSLDIHLCGVPKLLRSLREWAPEAFTVSFKLETDETILLAKARGAIEKYGVHCVVANILSKRYEEVTLVAAGQCSTAEVVRRPPPPPSTEGGQAHEQDHTMLVEELFIPRLCACHATHMAARA
jgi:phosphopantothenate---cysteine ligase (ATP)